MLVTSRGIHFLAGLKEWLPGRKNDQDDSRECPNEREYAIKAGIKVSSTEASKAPAI
jgi:hypothetical protein